MSQVDEAYEKFLEIRKEVEANLDQIVTEEDAKTQIITRIITECLGWSFADIGNERHHENGFSDYMLSIGDKNCVVIEAKKIGKIELGIANKSVQANLKLKGPGLIASLDGIKQAASYAQPMGAQIALLTDGNIWIFFKPNVAGEDYLEKQAYVFPSISSISSKFALFYELGSKNAFSKRTYQRLFDELHNNRTLLDTALVAPISGNDIFRQNKSQLAFALDPVFDKFFSRMTGEDDPDLIVECFVETRESRVADHSLEKMTARVLGNISNLQGDIEADLSEYFGKVVELDTGESVFIVGPTGSGKSTFLERFFRKTLETETRKKCIPIRINFLGASGSNNVQNWATENLVEQIEGQLFDDGSPTWDELRAMYFSDYKRLSRGVYAKLYEQDKPAFQQKFSEFMADKVESDREGYLQKLLYEIVYNRQKLPVIIADNTDEFSSDFKEIIFQYVQSLRVNTKHCIIVFPITDKSAWSFTKTDIYSIYQSKSFYLPTPPPREVFRKRLEYLKEKVELAAKSDGDKRYFTESGIQVSIDNLTKFADVVEDAFVNDEYSAKILGELSNYNIRRTLRLARRVITSPVFKIDDLIVAFTTGLPTYNRHAKFLNALMRGDFNYFNRNDVDAAEIIPLFQVDSKIRQSPLLKIRILSLLDAVGNAATSVEQRYLSISNISDFFQVLGCTEIAIDNALLNLMESNLAEPFDPSVRHLEPEQMFAINFSGRQHLRFSLQNPIYFEQMAITTEILNEDTTSMISSTLNSELPVEKKFASIRSIFAQYLLEEDQLFVSVPELSAQFSSQHDVSDQIKGYITVDKDEDYNKASKLEAGISPAIHEGVLGTVDFFDLVNGFGFVEIPEIGERCYIGHKALRDSGLERINDGDDILCDISPSPKGPLVSKIHDIQNKPNEVTSEICEVVRLHEARHFGFVSVFGKQNDALFHFSLMNEEELKQLVVGTRFEAQVRINSKNGLQQVGRIERIL